MNTATSKTYYEALEIQQDATSTIIKKAYRRLALKYHPDKNREPSATDQFRAVSEAYEVLSDDDQKREYDRALRSGMGGGGGGTHSFDNAERHNQWERQRGSRHTHRDPFAQFNDLFQNDPFFREAADGLDDLFSKTFQRPDHHTGGNSHSGSTARQNNRNNNKHKQGWGSWMADKLGINFEMTTTTTDRHGQRSASTFSQQSSRSRSTSHSTYTSKSTRTVIENGKRVTIQSMERDGNKIEEKYVGKTLVGRTINGVAEQVERIDL